VHRNIFLSLVLIVTVGLCARSQEKPTVKTEPAPKTNPTSGSEMYRTYCAVCHGPDGKGNGPAAPAMKVPPTDLTQLSRKNGGTFPDMRVSSIIQGDNVLAAHGSREMPMWGDVFRGVQRDEAMVKLRVHNLTQYVASLQQK
jgi:mono/diheme cytochrome c family protein